MPIKKPAKATKVAKKVVKNAPCCEGGDDCCGGKDDRCCGDSKFCCCSGKGHGFWATIVVVIVLAVVAYFAYTSYMNKSNAPYTIGEDNGVTTIAPGPGFAPNGHPAIVPPTVPPPTN